MATSPDMFPAFHKTLAECVHCIYKVWKIRKNKKQFFSSGMDGTFMSRSGEMVKSLVLVSCDGCHS